MDKGKMSKEEILDFVEKKAVEAQLRDDTCARSTLHGLSCYFDCITEKMVAASWAFTGGVAASSGSCGALCSSLFAIGAKYMPTVKEVENNVEGTQERFEFARDKMFAFRDAFAREFGGLTCYKVQEGVLGRGYNLLEEKELVEFLNLEGHREECGKVVGKAARMAAEFMLDD